MNNGNDAAFNWDKLLKRIVNNEVIPVVGEGLYVVHGPNREERPLYAFLAEELAREAQFTITPGMSHPFARAAGEFLRLPRRDAYDLQDFLRQCLSGLKLPLSSPLLLLARIKPFRLFICATHDHFLETALKTVRGVSPEPGSFYYSPQNLTELDQLNERLREKNHGAEPLILHIYGSLEKSPAEAAWTEGDIIERIVSLQEQLPREKTQGRFLYPELNRKALLVLGCGYDDWLFRFFIRTLSTQAYDRLEVPIHRYFADNLTLPPASCPDSLREFMTRSGMSVYYSSCGVSFISELLTRLTAQHPELTISESGFPAVAFISFHGADRAAARTLHDQLKKDGVSAWLDETDFQPGDQVSETILDAIERCPVFIPLLSAKAREFFPGGRMAYHYQEWRWLQQLNLSARNKRLREKTIIPVSLDGVSWHDPVLNKEDRMFSNAYTPDFSQDPVGGYNRLRDTLRGIRDGVDGR